jgi:hypothetical protein
VHGLSERLLLDRNIGVVLVGNANLELRDKSDYIAFRPDGAFSGLTPQADADSNLVREHRLVASSPKTHRQGEMRCSLICRATPNRLPSSAGDGKSNLVREWDLSK